MYMSDDPIKISNLSKRCMFTSEEVIVMRKNKRKWMRTIMVLISVLLCVTAVFSLAYSGHAEMEERAARMNSFLFKVKRKGTGSSGSKMAVVEDWIIYENLKPGEEYCIDGTLLKCPEESTLAAIRAGFTPERSSGILILRYQIGEEDTDGADLLAKNSLFHVEVLEEGRPDTVGALLGPATTLEQVVEDRSHASVNQHLYRILNCLLRYWRRGEILEFEYGASYN